MRGWLVIGMVLVAGCTSDGGEGEDRDGDPDAPADPLAAPAPWAVGDWWTYQLANLQAAVTWVVTEDAGDAWIVDVDHAEFRFFHDAFAPVSTIGEISKAHLAGSQDQPVRFFDFPLTINKTWSMQWDGATWQAQVVDVSGPTAEILARRDDGAVRAYVYDAELGWFRSITALDANGTQEFATTLADRGSGFTRPYVRWDVFPRFEQTWRPGQGGAETFDVPAEAEEFWFRLDVFCDAGGIEGDQGAWHFSIAPQDGQGFSQQGACPDPFHHEDVLAAVEGEWGVSALSAGGTVTALAVPRTLVEAML